MAQKVLSYEYEIEDGKSGLTCVGGLPTYLDLSSATGLMRSIDRHLKIRTGDQGWTDRQIADPFGLMQCRPYIDELDGPFQWPFQDTKPSEDFNNVVCKLCEYFLDSLIDAIMKKPGRYFKPPLLPNPKHPGYPGEPPPG